MMLTGFPRPDGRKGIRNTAVVCYLVECAHHVARQIAMPFVEHDVHVIGFPGCAPSDYAERMLAALTTHPNVGAVLLVSLGCESTNKYELARTVEASGRPVETITIQGIGGTKKAMDAGRDFIRAHLPALEAAERVPMSVDELVIGTICGGSDGTSGITGNPAAGLAFDRLVSEGATCIFEETGELIGCEHVMAARAATPELGEALKGAVEKAARYYDALGFGSFASGNALGGLTTIEEKSLGAYAKSGASEIIGMLKPGDLAPRGGLYLLDIVPDGEVRGFPNINDNTEIAELMACGCHLNYFITGRGSVVGSAISPVIKICANPETYARMSDDMDINAGRVLQGTSLSEVGDEIYALTMRVACGERTRSEDLGHREFIMGYKNFEPLGPACLPAA